MMIEKMCHKVFVFLTCALFVVLGAQAKTAKLSAVQVSIVDCLLPGKVRKLGVYRTYITAKQPIKTSANECEIRGGDYVLYDRASLSTSLNVWQESASKGDAQAQYFVGEIFEKGLGQSPDYFMAAAWYGRSAKQGYSPAMMSLGRLHEEGKGVERDLVKAMNLYRQASGLDNEEIAYASVFEALKALDDVKIDNLEQQLSAEKERSSRLNKQSLSLKSKLQKSKNNMGALQSDIAELKQNLNEADEKLSQLDYANTQKLLVDLQQSQQRLSDQTALSEVLRAEIKALQESKESSQLLQQELQRSKDALASLTSASEDERVELSAALTQIETLKKQLKASSVEDRSVEESYVSVSEELQRENDVLNQRLKVANTRVAHQEKQLAEMHSQQKSMSQQGQKTSSENEILSYGYTRAKNELAALKVETSALETQLQVSELKVKSLLASKSNSDSEKITAMQEALDTQEKKYQNELARIKSAEKDQQKIITTLTQQLSMKTQTDSDKQKYIAALQEKLSMVESQATQQQVNYQTAKDEAQKARHQVFGLLLQVNSLPQSQLLQKQLSQKQQELEAESARRLELANTLKETEQEKQLMGQKLDELLPKDGPVITVKWPEFKYAGGKIKGQATAGSIVNVVGAVHPAKKVTEFTINGEKVELDANGLFLNPVALSNQAITLNLQAKDDLGKITTSELLITPTFKPKVAAEKIALAKTGNVKLGKYHALIFGNNTYDPKKGWDPLDTAVNDAREMAKVLEEQYDFDVQLELNADRDTMLLSLERMRKKLTANDNLLVYYAGHGLIDAENGQGYWVPIDGSTDSSVKWVSNSAITDQIRAMTARNVMVIADSCYSASMMRSGVVTLRSGLTSEKKVRRLEEDIQTVTRVALSSGGLQPVSDSIDNSKNSVFTSALLTVLKNNYKLLDADALATEVGMMVSVATQDTVRQVPRYAPLTRGGHQGGEFYFSPKRKLATNN